MSDTLEGREKTRFPLLLILGLLMAVAIIVVAFVVDSDYGYPVLLLTIICAVAAIGYRVIAGRSGGSSGGGDADSTDGGIPKQEARGGDTALGDTPDAHDEINPHDLPLSNPGRQEAEKMAQGIGGTTGGHSEGGAAGHVSGSGTGEVTPGEASRGAGS